MNIGGKEIVLFMLLVFILKISVDESGGENKNISYNDHSQVSLYKNSLVK